MKWIFLLASSAIASLVFTAFNDSKRELKSAQYSTDEVSIENTVLKLNDNRLTISGLSNQDYVLCFREGSLVFPNTPEDQHHEHEISILEGDVLVWTRLEWQPASFVQDLYDGLKEDQINFEDVYHFGVQNSVTLLSRAKSKVIAVKKRAFQAFTYIVPTLAFLFLFILVFTVIIPAGRHPAPPKPSPCLASEMVSYRLIIFNHNHSRFSENVCFQVEEGEFRWIPETIERALACLAQWRPEKDPSLWEAEYISRNILYDCQQSVQKIRRFCPLKLRLDNPIQDTSL